MFVLNFARCVKIIKKINDIKKKVGTIILERNISSLPNTHSYKIA